MHGVFNKQGGIVLGLVQDGGGRTAPHVPRIWKRYVDDTFCVMERQHVDMFFEHINSIRPSIQFTMDLEGEGSLPFLDTNRTEEHRHHAWNEHHCPDWDNTSTLDQAKHNSTLLVKEAMHISLAEANILLNRDQGTTIADCWKPLLK